MCCGRNSAEVLTASSEAFGTCMQVSLWLCSRALLHSHVGSVHLHNKTCLAKCFVRGNLCPENPVGPFLFAVGRLAWLSWRLPGSGGGIGVLVFSTSVGAPSFLCLWIWQEGGWAVKCNHHLKAKRENLWIGTRAAYLNCSSSSKLLVFALEVNVVWLCASENSPVWRVLDKLELFLLKMYLVSSSVA